MIIFEGKNDGFGSQKLDILGIPLSKPHFHDFSFLPFNTGVIDVFKTTRWENNVDSGNKFVHFWGPQRVQLSREKYESQWSLSSLLVLMCTRIDWALFCAKFLLNFRSENVKFSGSVISTEVAKFHANFLLNGC
jgi:hypothetical protein